MIGLVVYALVLVALVIATRRVMRATIMSYPAPGSFAEAMLDARRAFDNLGNTLASSLAPAVASLASSISSFAEQSRRFAREEGE